MDNNFIRDLEDFDESEYIQTSDYASKWTSYPLTIDLIEPRVEENKSINNNSQSRNRKKNRGKSFSELQALRRFFKGLKNPKKEYVRCKLIRGHKRAVRSALKNEIPSKTIHKIDPSSSEQIDNWSKFALNVKQNEKILSPKSMTIDGPKTDGKNKRKLSNIQNEPLKSFSDEYCRYYFNDSIVVESFIMYLAVIFSNMNPENLIERFDFRCCKNQENTIHTVECNENWNELKKYLQENMIQELQINKESQVSQEFKLDEEVCSFINFDD